MSNINTKNDKQKLSLIMGNLSTMAEVDSNILNVILNMTNDYIDDVPSLINELYEMEHIKMLKNENANNSKEIKELKEHIIALNEQIEEMKENSAVSVLNGEIEQGIKQSLSNIEELKLIPNIENSLSQIMEILKTQNSKNRTEDKAEKALKKLNDVREALINLLEKLQNDKKAIINIFRKKEIEEDIEGIEELIAYIEEI